MNAYKPSISYGMVFIKIWNYIVNLLSLTCQSYYLPLITFFIIFLVLDFFYLSWHPFRSLHSLSTATQLRLQKIAAYIRPGIIHEKTDE